MHCPTTVTSANPNAWPGIYENAFITLATAFPAMAAVPKLVNILWVASLPNWNIEFSSAAGIPTFSMLRIMGSDKRTRFMPARVTMWLPPTLPDALEPRCDGDTSMINVIEAAAVRDSSVEIAAPATPKCITKIKNKLPPMFIMFTSNAIIMGTRLFPIERNIAAFALYTAKKGYEAAVIKKYIAAFCITSSAMVPYKILMMGRRNSTATVVVKSDIPTTAKINCRAAALAFSLSRRPMNWLTTTAPPADSEANAIIKRLLMLSTMFTPETAASPTVLTIIVSAAPIVTARICSIMSGHSSRTILLLFHRACTVLKSLIALVYNLCFAGGSAVLEICQAGCSFRSW
jgi:hypothetical protein